MATVAIRFPTQSPLSVNAAGQIQLSGQNVTMINEYHQTITLPIVAPTTQYGELAPNWQQVPRPGVIEPAFNVRGPRPLRTITLQVTVVDMTNTTNPIDDLLNSITTFLQKSTSIQLSYATFDNQYVSPSGTWVCTSWQPAVLVRDPDSWSPISVQGNLVLTEANPQPFAANTPTGITAPGPNSTVVSPAAPSVPAQSLHQAGSSTKSYPQGQTASTASGTAQQGSKVLASSVPTSPSSSTPLKPPGVPIANNYIVISGDTLTKISVKMYGVTTGWKVIAQANSINDPRPNVDLPPGKVLTIPGAPQGGYAIKGQGPVANNPFHLTYTNLSAGGTSQVGA